MKYKKEIEEIVWELHGQHQADYHMEETDDIKRDLKKSIDQLQALIDRVVREREKEIFNFWDDSIRMAWMDEDGNVASTKVLNTWLKSTKEHCQLNDSEK